MTFRRSNQKPRTKKSHVMEQIFLSPVKNTKNSQRIREIVLPFYISWVDTGIFITNFCDFNFVCVTFYIFLHFVFNSIPSSCDRVATPLSEMSWTSYGSFHDFSILVPFLDDFLALKSKN